MRIICDTHVLLFWADMPEKLSNTAQSTLEQGISDFRPAVGLLRYHSVGNFPTVR